MKKIIIIIKKKKSIRTHRPSILRHRHHTHLPSTTTTRIAAHREVEYHTEVRQPRPKVLQVPQGWHPAPHQHRDGSRGLGSAVLRVLRQHPRCYHFILNIVKGSVGGACINIVLPMCMHYKLFAGGNNALNRRTYIGIMAYGIIGGISGFVYTIVKLVG